MPSALLTVTEAYNQSIRTANRAWLAAATLTVIAIGASEIETSGSVAGINLSGYYLFAALTITIAAINFRLCSALASLYESHRIFHQYLLDIDAKNQKVSESISFADIAHRLTDAAYNRIYPILFAINVDRREKVMNVSKPVFETIYMVIPLAGMVVAFLRSLSSLMHEAVGFSGYTLFIITLAFVIVQIPISLITLRQSFLIRKRLPRA